jgi:hypothetical protein
MKRAIIVAVIGATTLLVALLDLATSAELVGSILFTLPLALCAISRSTRVLWGTLVAAVVLTITAEVWGFNRVDLDPWVASANRGCSLRAC